MTTAIIWFRRDLRLADNPALLAALAAADTVIPVYIHPLSQDSPWPMGSASRWWLHHSLKSLDSSLRSLGSGLLIRRGEPLEVLRDLIAATGADWIYWNRLYEPSEIARDTRLKQALREDGLAVETCNSRLLYEPWEIKRTGGEPYRVFTPFWKSMQALGLRRPPEPAPRAMPPLPEGLQGESLDQLQLLPRISWDKGFYAFWPVGESAAHARLDEFSDTSLACYKTGRDHPGQAGTSRLSPHLHFGEISPRQIVDSLLRDLEFGLGAAGESYLREIAWREFAAHLLFHCPGTAEQPLDRRFLRFPWRTEYAEDLSHWHRGETGFPVVDAGMRELWHTGWMHNRVRMIVASLLTKNLLIPWQEGAKWFWDTLVDADLASNTMGWQWTAGCGADAAPYFRIFNPTLQGERFDPEGDYVRRWVPELSTLPARIIHKPWEAGASVLAGFDVTLGKDYPYPRVDLRASRERALAAFGAIKNPVS